MSLHSSTAAIWLLQLFVSAFLAILFLQSGIDKVLDRRGNLQWLTDHFAKSPLHGFVPLLLTVITLLELAAGLLTGLGCFVLLFRHESAIAYYGALFAALSLGALFFGQRIAKEYAGAAVLVPYFLLTILGIYLLSF
jgi:uncharacterized membrane protein YphA (DoxX/SURF4 family)